MELKDNLKNATTRSGAKFQVISKVSDLRGDRWRYVGSISINGFHFDAEWSQAGGIAISLLRRNFKIR